MKFNCTLDGLYITLYLSAFIALFLKKSQLCDIFEMHACTLRYFDENK
jgi:hypothetical protein